MVEVPCITCLGMYTTAMCTCFGMCCSKMCARLFGPVDNCNVSVLTCPTWVSDVVIVLEKVSFFGLLPCLA